MTHTTNRTMRCILVFDGVIVTHNILIGVVLSRACLSSQSGADGFVKQDIF